MNIKVFLAEATEALSEQTIESLEGFIEKWVPVVTDTVSALRQENSLLELAITEAQEE